MLCFLHLLFYDATQDIILLHRHPIILFVEQNIFYSNTCKRFCINKGFSKYVYKIADRTIINPDDKINDANNIEYTRIVSLFSINSISLKIETTSTIIK